MKDNPSEELIGVKEIARRANVSIGTVDRVLHNRSGVSLATRDKILSIIKELNYQPNILARLASKKVLHIAVLIPAPLLKLIYKIKGTQRTALITDAMRAAGMPPGPSILGGLKTGLPVIVEDNVAKLPDRSAFAGSVATADQLVRNMIVLAEVH